MLKIVLAIALLAQLSHATVVENSYTPETRFHGDFNQNCDEVCAEQGGTCYLQGTRNYNHNNEKVQGFKDHYDGIWQDYCTGVNWGTAFSNTPMRQNDNQCWVNRGKTTCGGKWS